jgi:hypothetical protein
MAGNGGIGGSFGFSNEKTKYSETSSIDALLRGLQEQNYQGAMGNLPTSYTPTSGAQITAQMNPYIQDVVNTTLDQAGRGQRMAMNQVADQASAGHAFGGSRHGVAEGVALGEYNNNLNSLIGNLYATGFESAAQRAQDENQRMYAYPLDRQNTLNQTLAGITPTTTTTGQSKTHGTQGKIAFTYGGGG